MIYVGTQKALISKFDNKLELFNEWMISITSMTVIFQTDWIGDIEMKY